MARMAATLLLILLFPSLAFAAGSALPPAVDLSLRYQAFLAGAAVGEATVNVAWVDGAYVVQGSAHSKGLMQRFSKWRTHFTATGEFDGMASTGAEFSYSERNSGSSRVVRVSDGVLDVQKNGRQRPLQPSPPGADLLNALFVPPHCGGDQVVHTGRYVYRLTHLEHNAAGCRYQVVDEDDDAFEMHLALKRIGELVVPERITIYGRVTGWMELVELDQVAGP
ncbi:MAG: DUF3108 domain-containing protein [Pseudomonadales bacterium]